MLVEIILPCVVVLIFWCNNKTLGFICGVLLPFSWYDFWLCAYVLCVIISIVISIHPIDLLVSSYLALVCGLENYSRIGHFSLFSVKLLIFSFHYII